MTAVFLLWVWYPLTVAAIVLPAALVTRDPALRDVPFLALHATVLALAVLVRLATRSRSARAQRAAWGAFTVCGLPCVFLSLGMVLPMVHPEPFEWSCIAFDRWLCGTDPLPVVQRTLTPLLTEVVQACYAVFYLLPVAAMVGVIARRDGAGYDRGLATIALCFMLSYVGYLIWPTLGPNRLGLWHQPVVGLGCAERLNAWISAAEANHWDCFPSGHTMLSLVSLHVAFRQGSKVVAMALVPIAACVIWATLALNYHYVADVLAGALGAALGLALSAWFVRAGRR